MSFKIQYLLLRCIENTTNCNGIGDNRSVIIGWTNSLKAATSLKCRLDQSGGHRWLIFHTFLSVYVPLEYFLDFLKGGTFWVFFFKQNHKRSWVFSLRFCLLWVLLWLCFQHHRGLYSQASPRHEGRASKHQTRWVSTFIAGCFFRYFHVRHCSMFLISEVKIKLIIVPGSVQRTVS